MTCCRVASYSIKSKNVGKALWDTSVTQQGEMVSGKALGTGVNRLQLSARAGSGLLDVT